MGLAVMAAQCALLFAFRGDWGTLFRAEPAVGENVAMLLQWVVLFNCGDGVQLCLSGVITGAGKQAVTTPILFVSYWLLGLPLGAVAAFKYGVGLLGLWYGMTGAVWLHACAYVAICFGLPCILFAIDWPEAARKAAERLSQPPVADAASVVADEPVLDAHTRTSTSINAS